MRNVKPYRIIGAYDSETTNIEIHGRKSAFPILHQLGLTDGTDVIEIDAGNVEQHVNISVFRNTVDLYSKLDEIASDNADYVPVIMCHNLSFDMYGLSIWLNRHDVRVLAKSPRKPITFTVNDENGNPCMVIWDTLIFTQQSLERMGEDCGFRKASGSWDYNLIRTPRTPLTDGEMEYARRDIFALFAWLGWWLRRNPDILPERLGLNVVTKTGIVRERRRVRFDHLKGNGQKENVGRYWLYRNRCEVPKSDDELYTMFASTRGGFTFCSMRSASVPYDFVSSGKKVVGYDATSQHPAQLVSHRYPVRFREMTKRVLNLAFEVIGKVSFERVLDRWSKPFPVAFYACFRFENLRPKNGTLFERFGIYPLASARYKPIEAVTDYDNGDKVAYLEEMGKRNYRDSCVNAKCAFGKIISADVAELYITELTAWEIWQAYEWDSVDAVHGYETGRFMRPSDMDVISTMQFYRAKDQFKIARSEFYETGSISNGEELKRLGIAPAIVASMENGMLDSNDVEAVYLGLKADLNSIFGINASNEYRRDTVMTSEGIGYEGDFGICNSPKNSKVWYQFGQRIVGWSRIAQICAMMLVERYAIEIVNGDTDSIKIVVDVNDLEAVDESLTRLSDAIDKAKDDVCSRVKFAYPSMYDPLERIGYYVREFEVERFCASWNKAYCTYEDGFNFTLAGIPTRKRTRNGVEFPGINGFADKLHDSGWSFADVCNVFLGYNVTYANDVIRLNGRKFPEWGELFNSQIVDYMGKTSNVVEPCALGLFPMSKTVNDTTSYENRANLEYALSNNPNVNMRRKLVTSIGVLDLEGDDDAGILRLE